MGSIISLDKNITGRLKAVAIICVIAGHILGGSFGVISPHVQAILGTGGVNVFLLLSGYGLFVSYNKSATLNLKTYWEAKINKIFIPYGAITVFYYGFMYMIGGAPGLMALARNILCIDYSRTIDETMWYMSFLLLWYIIFFCIFYLKYPRFIKIAIMFAFGYIFNTSMFSNVFLECNWQFSTNAYAFPAGVLIAYLIDIINNISKIRNVVLSRIKYIQCILFIYGATCFVLGVFQLTEISYLNYGISYIVVLYPLFRNFDNNNLFWRWTSNNSFELYLLEAKLISIVSYIGVFNNNWIIWCIVYVLVTIVSVNIYNFIYSNSMNLIKKYNL